MVGEKREMAVRGCLLFLDTVREVQLVSGCLG